jgi:hypothetical protein
VESLGAPFLLQEFKLARHKYAVAGVNSRKVAAN